MTNLNTNFRRLFSLIFLFIAVVFFGLFLWQNYFFALSPIATENAKTASFLDIQSLQKAAQIRRNISQLTTSLPSATLNTSSSSAQVKGSDTVLSIDN